MVAIKYRTTINRILPTGSIEIEEYKQIWENDALIMEDSKPHNRVIEPDMEYDGDDDELIRHIAIAHRPEKKAAFIQHRIDARAKMDLQFNNAVIAARAETKERGETQ